MKKALCAALAVLMALTLLPGCKKESGSLTADGKVKLLIGLPGGSGVTAMKVVDNFKAATADKYEVTTDETAWGDFTQKLQLQVAAKTGVTPVWFTDSMQAMTMGANGQVEDLMGWANSELDTSLYNQALFAIKDEAGHLWGVPHALNAAGVIINKDILEERGVAYPSEDWTWEQMLNMAAELTFTRADGSKVYGIDYLANITLGWLPFMSAVGVQPYKDNYQYSNLDDPKIVEAMEKYAAPIRAGHVMSGPEISALGGTAQAFSQGHIAMAIIQSSSIAQINNWTPDLNYDVMMLPIGWNGGRASIYVPNTWQIYSGAEDVVKDAAKDWLKYYLSEEAQMINASECPSGFPIMKAALDTIAESGRKPANIKAFYEGIDEYGQTLLENPSSAVSRSIVDAMTGDIKLNNDMDIAARVAEAHEDMVRTLDDFYER
ncbi:MAG: extracellular solute-binding protein [Ruminococcaceae bacterium]|nr:extracellular solute-binding protein [Oscillospiraceae bacterium]